MDNIKSIREVYDILEGYSGNNNYILNLKEKSQKKNFLLTDNQRKYVKKHHLVKSKVAKKWVDIDVVLSEDLQVKKILPQKPKKIWVEKILTESDKAYHIWGKVIESESNYPFWVPKSQIIVKNNKTVTVDYTPFKHRPPMGHQKEAIEIFTKK